MVHLKNILIKHNNNNNNNNKNDIFLEIKRLKKKILVEIFLKK